jgi:hypothetical protein
MTMKPRTAASVLHPILIATAAVLALTAPSYVAARESHSHSESHSVGGGRTVSSQPDFEWSGALKPGQRLWIKNVNGAIHAEPTSGNEVSVQATKSWRRSDPDDVKIDVSKDDEGVAICTIYPNAFGSRPNSCETGDNEHSNTRNNDVSVEYWIKVPKGVSFSPHTVNGSLEIRDLTGPVDARTVNGSIDVSTDDQAQAATVNGSIHARLGSANWKDTLEFESVNGQIEVSLPSDVGAEIEASSVNGDIESDFPLTVHGRIGRHHVEGTLGKGGSPLKVHTVNGGIHLRQASGT